MCVHTVDNGCYVYTLTGYMYVYILLTMVVTCIHPQDTSMCVHTVDNGCYVYTLTGYRIHVHIHTVDDDCYMHVLIGFMMCQTWGQVQCTSVLVPDCN